MASSSQHTASRGSSAPASASRQRVGATTTRTRPNVQAEAAADRRGARTAGDSRRNLRAQGRILSPVPQAQDDQQPRLLAPRFPRPRGLHRRDRAPQRDPRGV
ncbi:hypothetical protein ACFPRL_29155 [Pseudoclavibacter helvolus]